MMKHVNMCVCVCVCVCVRYRHANTAVKAARVYWQSHQWSASSSRSSVAETDDVVA